MGTKGRVLATPLTDRLPVLFPEQRQGDVRLLQLLMAPGVVGFRKGQLPGRDLPVNQLFQSAVFLVVRQWLGQPGGTVVFPAASPFAIQKAKRLPLTIHTASTASVTFS